MSLALPLSDRARCAVVTIYLYPELSVSELKIRLNCSGDELLEWLVEASRHGGGVHPLPTPSEFQSWCKVVRFIQVEGGGS